MLGHLTALLDSSSSEFLALLTTFLHNLCQAPSTRAQLCHTRAASALVSLLPASRGTLLVTMLHLLRTLVLDERMQQQLTQAGLIPCAMGLLQSAQRGGDNSATGAPPSQLLLGLLHQLSSAEQNCSLFLYTGESKPARTGTHACRARPPPGWFNPPPPHTHTDAPQVLHALLLRVPGQLAGCTELAGLAINLAQNARYAEEASSGSRLEQLVQRGLEAEGRRDVLLWRLLHALAAHHHDGAVPVLAPRLAHLVELLLVRGRWGSKQQPLHRMSRR